MAGFILADGFGRAGWWGYGLAGLTAVGATFLGAMIGAATLGLWFAGDADFAAWGVVAVTDGATSPLLLLTWIAAMIGVDAFARWVVASTPSPSPQDIFG